MNYSLAENGESYHLDPDCYYYLSKLGLTADRAGLMITSLEHLADKEDGAELFLVEEGLGVGFAIEVRRSTLKLFLVPVDGNAARNRFRILGTENTPDNWERITVAILRFGLRCKRRKVWTEALRSEPIDLEDLIVVCA